MSSRWIAPEALRAAAAAGLLPALMETASILSLPGAAIASAGDLAMLVTWLAVPYALMAAACGLAGGLLLGRAAGIARTFAGTASAGAILMWLRPMARLGQGTPSHIPLEILLALVALGGGFCLAGFAGRMSGPRWILAGLSGLACLLILSRNVPGPFGRALPPPGLVIRLGVAALACLAVAGAASAMARWKRSRPAQGGISRAVVSPVAACVIIVAWLGFAAWGFADLLRFAPEPVAPSGAALTGGQGRPNIVLISVDTLRADHLSCYGYGHPTSPAIDRLAAEGVLYKRTASTASFTLPSHASMMTGLFPTSHGATYQNRDPRSFTVRGMDTSYPTLAELLRDQGYDTAGFVSGPLLSRQFGFGRGFRWYDDRYDRLKSARARLLSRTMLFRALRAAGVFSDRDLDSQRLAGEMNPLVESWLDSRAPGRPFFLFVHYWDPHGPYDPPLPFGGSRTGAGTVDYDMDRLLTGDYTMTPRALATMLTLYDGEISYVDSKIGELMERLRKDGTLDRSLVILTADHGESFGEHDHWEHSRVLYEDLLHVPFIVRMPEARFAGTALDDVIAQPTDILPMALSVAGLPVPEGIEGRDLTQWLGPRQPPGPLAHPPHPLKSAGLAFAEVDRNIDWPKSWGARFDRDLVSARTSRWKYIKSSTGREELYDLDRDPGELSNLAAGDADTTARLRALIEAWRLTLRLPDRQGLGEIDEGLRENLRSLGYVQ